MATGLEDGLLVPYGGHLAGAEIIHRGPGILFRQLLLFLFTVIVLFIFIGIFLRPAEKSKSS